MTHTLKASQTIRWLILSVLILTLIDVACTVTGVLMGVIIEGNPIWQSAMRGQPILAGVAAIVYTALLMAFVYKYGRKFRTTVPLLAFVCMVKLGIVGMHVNWIMQAI
jgi:hypothetical protein